MAIVSPRDKVPDGFYWFIPEGQKVEEQPVRVQNGEVWLCGVDFDFKKLYNEEPHGVFVPLTTRIIRGHLL